MQVRHRVAVDFVVQLVRTQLGLQHPRHCHALGPPAASVVQLERLDNVPAGDNAEISRQAGSRRSCNPAVRQCDKDVARSSCRVVADDARMGHRPRLAVLLTELRHHSTRQRGTYSRREPTPRMSATRTVFRPACLAE